MLGTTTDVQGIVAFMRTVLQEHIDGYNNLDSEGLLQTTFYELECNPLKRDTPTCYLLAIKQIEQEHKGLPTVTIL